MEQMTGSEIWDYRAGKVAVVVARGDLDAYVSADFRRRLSRALAKAPDALLVDLDEVTFMDAVALGVLVDAVRKARLRGLVLRLVAPSPPVRRLFRLTQTEQVFSIDSDLVAAFARVA